MPPGVDDLGNSEVDSFCGINTSTEYSSIPDKNGYEEEHAREIAEEGDEPRFAEVHERTASVEECNRGELLRVS